MTLFWDPRALMLYDDEAGAPPAGGSATITLIDPASVSITTVGPIVITLNGEGDFVAGPAVVHFGPQTVDTPIGIAGAVWYCNFQADRAQAPGVGPIEVTVVQSGIISTPITFTWDA